MELSKEWQGKTAQEYADKLEQCFKKRINNLEELLSNALKGKSNALEILVLDAVKVKSTALLNELKTLKP